MVRVRETAKQIVRFCIVGVIAFIIDFTLLVFLSSVCGINYLISATISYCVSLVFNYFASMRFVFKRKSEMSRKRAFVIFVVLTSIGLGINDLCMWIGVEFLAIDYRIVKVGATAVVMVWNFVTRKVFLDSSK
jgi:putative flippase GtrA